MTRAQTSLTELARLGFAELDSTVALLDELSAAVEVSRVLPLFALAADADQALGLLCALQRQSPSDTAAALGDADLAQRLVRVLGASAGLGEFLLRHPDELEALRGDLPKPLGADEYRADLRASVTDVDGEEAAWNALRTRYRHHLVRLTAFDLAQPDPLAAIATVSAALADLAAGALDASLDVARKNVGFPPDQVAATRLAIIGMGKAGARELNYVSDVDVIFAAEPASVLLGGEFVGDGAPEPLSTARAVEIATRLAMLTMRGIHELALEPPLWEVDANLRPEGKDGALVRTLESHIAYYDRWAKSWEFQALLKARPLAGDLDLGNAYVDAIAPKVWNSASRDGFVEGVQRMRERVTQNIPGDELDYQLKLGPGGLRDIEFTIQLLQLVHGQTDPEVRQGGTLPALAALAEQGYIGRVESAEFARDYRFLRLLEHRLQLAKLRRTHLMPSDPDAVRILARATGLTSSGADLIERWSRTKRAVRSLHERLFYRPLLSAVAALPEEGMALTSSQAEARLAAIGFRDPRGALAHIAALTTGVSRRANIQRHLLPVMLQWFAEGADPDYGLLAFRKLSDDLGESYWFLRMLRDSSGAAQRLTSVLSASRFVGVLLERIPEAAAWLEQEEELRPRSLEALLEEAAATVARHHDEAAAALALRSARRREVLRLAMAAVLGQINVEELGRALTDITTTLLTGVLSVIRSADPQDGIEFGIIAMGRYGGAELGFGSDADVVYVYRATTATPETAQARAEMIVSFLQRYTEDLRLPLDLDIGLRPEGKNGAVVRSLDSYRAYYRRWSLTWEAQALLRADGAVGDEGLLLDFVTMADEVRYPANIPEHDVREVRRIKARVESERLPQAADPARHLKLGRGSLSDVEWFVQLIQLQHAARIPALRTTSTLDALDAARDNGFVSDLEARRLRDAWIFASRARSAMTLWTAKTADVLPTDRQQLEGVARLLEYPPGSASRLEEDYLRVTRLARAVFEKRFYG
ncbi:bifunctional [glutamine synthetase] adenylyltransferase/[glutamine synthetase]-adenylyl-L-tyrosine phosphorylase [Lacisediminihabitans changchengi]|uniref:Bifunctional [glutamine synthetase] adenylyltransferase/[glutamine synthetase]-adenylyl-L-tyrosine phosphorylase n=1 Tax=Lacisediminihabitans changchengi TaxID=2787634 RepID=A0A934SMN0_9MICO|nr:bifunctional [glutamine synthetase] adenylyltransferase/[glutamine synthetase]-adenylyl-L-tyrosine phosphorylase [Lacisediminihabitans changchengi]MBK4346702.1 bifunctional [glutamine synthetase] adenylyltransferase/[glutamine synthetase]-adenylyl-L-tyrosine phosphorylase [Lacisediminihabitans changchengi]MBK4348175.1 bifunctional [glutamine synthetase] adenylyltransferase/[glutamine synthetase]-adenylyl-L-tyrosine phosphorylase [Lacisediminihabitans changchengi]